MFFRFEIGNHCEICRGENDQYTTDEQSEQSSDTFVDTLLLCLSSAEWVLFLVYVVEEDPFCLMRPFCKMSEKLVFHLFQ